MSSITDSPTKFAILQYLEDPSTNPAINQNDSLPEKWLNDALTWEDAWSEIKPIKWEYWFTMPAWAREDAAYLFFGVCPIRVERKSTPEDLTVKIMEFIKMAEAKQINNLCSRDWLRWGEMNNFCPVGGFRNALMSFTTIKKAEGTESISKDTNSKYVSKLVLRQSEIIRLIESKGLIPKSLPKPEPGKAGIKAEIYAEAQKNKQLFTYSTFRTAWDALRGEGQIIDKK